LLQELHLPQDFLGKIMLKNIFKFEGKVKTLNSFLGRVSFIIYNLTMKELLGHTCQE
jgi:hypothetical protein